MRKKKILIPFAIIMLIIALVVCGIIIIYRSNLPKENALTFCLQNVNGNSNWAYEFSNNSILKVTEDSRYMNIFHIYEYWVFEPTESGEVTIFFNCKERGWVVEEYSFSITYYIDGDGNIEEISSDNKPEMTNIKDDMAGFIGIKVHDFIYCTVVRFAFWVRETFFYTK